MRRSEAPRSESQSQRMADAGLQAIDGGHYTKEECGIVSGVAGGRFFARSGLLLVQGAGTVGTCLAIPKVAITSDPRVEVPRKQVDARNEQHPREELPSGKGKPDPGPGIHAEIDAPVPVDRLHPTHRFIEVYLRKARRDARVVQVY